MAVVAVGYSLGAWPSPPVLGNLAVTEFATAGYVANWVIVTSPAGVLSHAWSLAVEEQFYLLWPITLLLGLRVLGPRGVAFAAIAVALTVTPWRYVLAGDPLRVVIGTDTHADALLLGCALALLKIRGPRSVGWIGVVGVVVLGAAWAAGPPGMVMYAPLVTVASVAALACCPALLAWRPLAYVGRISYGLYLWHYLLIWWVGLASTAHDCRLDRHRRRVLRMAGAPVPASQESFRALTAA